MAEIEHFCSPHDKSHKKFPSIANEMLTLYSSSNQMDGKSAQILTIGEAVESVGTYFYPLSIWYLRLRKRFLLIREWLPMRRWDIL